MSFRGYRLGIRRDGNRSSSIDPTAFGSICWRDGRPSSAMVSSTVSTIWSGGVMIDLNFIVTGRGRNGKTGGRGADASSASVSHAWRRTTLVGPRCRNAYLDL